MSYYVIKPGITSRVEMASPRGYLAHQWALPGVVCPVCGETWATTGIHYPTVDLAALPNAVEYTKHRAVGLQEFEKLRNALLSLMPDGSIPPPGTRFGPIVGEAANGVVEDFAWINSWTLLLPKGTLSQLSSEGIDLSVCAAQINYASAPGPELFEPQILPAAYLAPGTGIREMTPCPECGRRGFSIKKGQPLVLDSDSFDAALSVFRLVDLPTYIVVNDQFRSLVNSRKLTGLVFHSIEKNK